MNYEIIETESMGQTQQHVIIDRGDGSYESFPVDEENPRYQQWVAVAPGNRHYEEYLQFLEEGGEPEVMEG